MSDKKYVSKLFMPYSVPVSELSNRLSLIGFDTSNYMTKAAESKLETILVLSSENLECIKVNPIQDTIPASTQFQIIEVDEPRDISDEIELDHIIISFVSPFYWGVGDDRNKYVPVKGKMYMEVHPKKSDDSTIHSGTSAMMFFCCELSHRFGTKFQWYTERYADSYIISTLDGCGINESAFNLIEKHKDEIEKIYQVSITIKKGVPRKVIRDDFEF